jgi:hypothetical protein
MMYGEEEKEWTREAKADICRGEKTVQAIVPQEWGRTRETGEGPRDGSKVRSRE